MLDIDNISFKNKKTWKIIKSGLTCGIFQLESHLGQAWARRIKPGNISELSALTALIRPGTLQNGLTEQYAKIKHGQMKPKKTGDHEIDQILDVTFGILLYQEQVIAIGERVAWSHLPRLERLIKADKLRKSIGKKDAKLLFSLREDFIEGCIENGRSKILANKTFDIIEKNARYGFNSAHAFKYGHHAYKTAYLKANYPLEFYCVYLNYSKEKQKPKYEIRQLIDESKILGINVLPPSIIEANPNFKITNRGKREIIYGLSHIKNVGQNDIDLLEENLIDNWNKLFLAHFVGYNNRKLNKRAVEHLIAAGACDSYGIPRRKLLEVYRTLRQLSKKELSFVTQKIEDLESIHELPETLMECADKISTKKRKELVRSEAKELDLDIKDTYTWRAHQETELLGIALTCSPIDDKDTDTKMKCRDCLTMEENKGVVLNISGVVEEIRVVKTKKGNNPGQEMAIISMRDKTGSIRVACFPKQYDYFQEAMFENVTYEVCVEGNGNGNWSIKYLEQI